MQHENLWNAAKDTLRDKFRAQSTNNGEKVRFQVNDLSFHPNKIEKDIVNQLNRKKK